MVSITGKKQYSLVNLLYLYFSGSLPTCIGLRNNYVTASSQGYRAWYKSSSLFYLLQYNIVKIFLFFSLQVFHWHMSLTGISFLSESTIWHQMKRLKLRRQSSPLRASPSRSSTDHPRAHAVKQWATFSWFFSCYHIVVFLSLLKNALDVRVHLESDHSFIVGLSHRHAGRRCNEYLIF